MSDYDQEPARRLAALERSAPPDPLGPSRGILVGVLVGSIFWIVVGVVLWRLGVIG